MKHIRIRALSTLAIFFILTSAQAGSVSGTVTGKTDWLSSEYDIAITKMTANISPADGAPGAVIASPSRSNPDYYYHWTRDGALVMETVAKLYQTTKKTTVKETLYQYVRFSRSNQLTTTLAGLGEPKFHANGSAFNGPWGRPQNDGPALRAIALVHFANILLSEGEETYVRTQLYDTLMPTQSVIKADLEYVAYHWRDASFDIWEECKGDHFYTRMVQRKALIAGAELAKKLGDPGAAAFYLKEAMNLRSAIEAHWDSNRQIIIPTLNRTDGIDYKSSGLDTAVVLGALHGDAGDGFMSVSDSRVQSTLQKLSESFASIYSINRRTGSPGVAMGRYPEDRYSGTNVNLGNPWVLTTLATAETYYHLAREWALAGRKQEADHAHELADQFVSRVQYHSNGDGSLSEQMNRETGYMTSARDLTWNYAAVLTAFWAREGK